jgi:hypothetical protein
MLADMLRQQSRIFAEAAGDTGADDDAQRLALIEVGAALGLGDGSLMSMIRSPAPNQVT